jgi:hypothetical protein
MKSQLPLHSKICSVENLGALSVLGLLNLEWPLKSSRQDLQPPPEILIESRSASLYIRNQSPPGMLPVFTEFVDYKSQPELSTML